MSLALHSSFVFLNITKEVDCSLLLFNNSFSEGQAGEEIKCVQFLPPWMRESHPQWKTAR